MNTNQYWKNEKSGWRKKMKAERLEKHNVWVDKLLDSAAGGEAGMLQKPKSSRQLSAVVHPNLSFPSRHSLPSLQLWNMPTFSAVCSHGTSPERCGTSENSARLFSGTCVRTLQGNGRAKCPIEETVRWSISCCRHDALVPCFRQLVKSNWPWYTCPAACGACRAVTYGLQARLSRNGSVMYWFRWGCVAKLALATGPRPAHWKRSRNSV